MSGRYGRRYQPYPQRKYSAIARARVRRNLWPRNPRYRRGYYAPRRWNTGNRYAIARKRNLAEYKRVDTYKWSTYNEYTIPAGGVFTSAINADLNVLKRWPELTGQLDYVYQQIGISYSHTEMWLDQNDYSTKPATEVTELMQAYDATNKGRTTGLNNLLLMGNHKHRLMRPMDKYHFGMVPKWGATSSIGGTVTTLETPRWKQEWFDIADLSNQTVTSPSVNAIMFAIKGTPGEKINEINTWTIKLKRKKHGMTYNASDEPVLKATELNHDHIVSALEKHPSYVPDGAIDHRKDPACRVNVGASSVKPVTSTPMEDLPNDSFEEYVRSFHGKTKKRMNYDTACPQESRQMPLN